MSHVKYRPDIDGLRAIAVLAVLIYHAGFKFLPGGFMGVDIFFVISGYLITSFIVADIKDRTFSMVGFWERRARRILPPLFAVVAATLIAGWFIFLPFDYVQLAKEMASQAAFGSNILFMMQGGYFADSDQFKALLHTWSLAVEEQFYLFFPIGMALFARFVSKKFFYLLLPAAVISFVLCVIVVGISDRIAFYSLPFRGWELLAGAIVAVSQSPTALKASLREILSALGLIMIAAALLFYRTSIAFPGYVGLLPVIGTALIIWGNGAGMTATGKALAIKPMVAVGLISYSLYLWHWPILVYARYIPIYEFNAGIALACIAAAFVLSILTWRYVEQPIRKKQIFPTRKNISLFSLVGLLIMAGLGAVIIIGKGLPQRFDDAVIAYASGKQDENPHREECDQPNLSAIEQSKVCQTNPSAGKPTFIMWGDSIGDAIAPAFYSLSQKEGRNGYVVTGHGCVPILEAKAPRSFNGFDCTKSNKAIFDLIIREKIKTLYLIGSWGNWLRPEQITFPDNDAWYNADKDRFNNITMAALQRMIDKLQEEGVKVYVVINPPPTPAPIDPPRQLALESRFGVTSGKAFTPIENYLSNRKDGIDTFRSLSGDADVTYIDPKPYLCDTEKCPLGRDGRSLYFNPGHLTAYGAHSLEPLIRPFFD